MTTTLQIPIESAKRMWCGKRYHKPKTEKEKLLEAKQMNQLREALQGQASLQNQAFICNPGMLGGVKMYTSLYMPMS